MNSSTFNLLKIRHIHTCCTLYREKLKNLNSMKHSSQLWLSRQMRDPYVEKAKQQNYRCRSAFKLLEINERFRIFQPGNIVVDCGAAPGSWTQVAVNLTNADKHSDALIGKVYSIDKLPIHPIIGATIMANRDFTHPETQNNLRMILDRNKANVVISDMAPNASGMRDMDHENIIMLAYSAMKFALQITRIGGTFLVKVWDGGRTSQLKQDLLKFYKAIHSIRPNATRTESSEVFLLARGFKGLKE